MRALLLVIAFGLLAHFGYAQAPQPLVSVSAPIPLSAVRYSSEDTLRAVWHLFNKRYRGAVSDLSWGSSVLADAALTTALRPAGTPPDARVETNQDWLVGSTMTGFGLFRTLRFSPYRYQLIVAAYQQGESLPTYVRRRLKPKFFGLHPR